MLLSSLTWNTLFLLFRHLVGEEPSTGIEEPLLTTQQIPFAIEINVEHVSPPTIQPHVSGMCRG